MPDRVHPFLQALLAVATAGILVTGIFASGLPDAEKWFAIAMFFLIVYIIYAESTFQKKERGNGEKTVKDKTGKGGRRDRAA